jgi:hypothetical protein
MREGCGEMCAGREGERDAFREAFRIDDFFEPLADSGSGPDSKEPKLRPSRLLSSSSAPLDGELLPSSLESIIDDVDDLVSFPSPPSSSLAFASLLRRRLSEMDFGSSFPNPSLALILLLLLLVVLLLSVFSMFTESQALVSVTWTLSCHRTTARP